MAKRAAQGGGNIRQRKDGRWEARYTVGRDPGTGKQVQRSIYGDSQQEVRKKLNQIIHDIDNGTYKEPCKLTMGAWLDIWAAEYLGGVKAHTAYLYRNEIKNHIKPKLGAVKLEALCPHEIQSLYNFLWKEKGLAPSSIKLTHSVLHKSLKQAVALGYIRSNPTDACTLPRMEREEIKPLDDAQVAAFLEAVKGNQFEDLFTFALFTGVRKGEAVGLTWDCVNFDQGTVRLEKQCYREPGKGGKYVFASLKNSKARTITPAPWVMRLLKAHRGRQNEQRLQAGELWEDSGLVFTNARGGHLANETVQRHYKKLVASIGLPDARLHDLRHTYAVNAIRAGDDIKSVQGNLGHATAAFTLDKYGHFTEAMKKDSAERMEGFIKGVLNL